MDTLQTVHGCDSIVTLDLTIIPTIELEIIAAEDDYCDKNMIVLQIVTNGNTYLWSTGNTEDQITALNPGIYFVTASIEHCEKTASYTIDECPCGVFIANTFTPNGNSLNDVFRPIFTYPEQLLLYHFYIYNRWGQLLFHTTDPEAGWDGNNAPQGVYAYLVEYKLSTERKNKQKKGKVTLLRL